MNLKLPISVGSLPEERRRKHNVFTPYRHHMIDKIKYRPYLKRVQRKHTNFGVKRHGRQREAVVRVMQRKTGSIYLQWNWRYGIDSDLNFVDYGPLSDFKNFLGSKRWNQLLKGKKTFYMNIFVSDFFYR